MTNEQSAIFRKVLDTNWEVKELTESSRWIEAIEKVKELDRLKSELKESMGEYEYNKFMDTGRKMFSPAED
jgi:hypothetical protein